MLDSIDPFFSKATIAKQQASYQSTLGSNPIKIPDLVNGHIQQWEEWLMYGGYICAVNELDPRDEDLKLLTTAFSPNQ